MIAGVPNPWVTNEKCDKCRWIETSKIGARRLFVPNGERSWANKSVNSLINCLKTKKNKLNVVFFSFVLFFVTLLQEYFVFVYWFHTGPVNDAALDIDVTSVQRIDAKEILDHKRNENLERDALLHLNEKRRGRRKNSMFH